MVSKSTIYRRRRAALDRVRELALRWGALERRVSPGHSCHHTPSEAAARDGQEAWDEQQAVVIELIRAGKLARELGAGVADINAAARPAPRLVSLEEVAWDDFGRPSRWRWVWREEPERPVSLLFDLGDPLGRQMAADWCEEQGRSAEAASLRRTGQ